ncbi:hypothetical protein DPEC_G00319420 [Dallia pectoralis]|uniref:Uncharacterized protein n=1 Tax=Dallia pectoralis TaxID=75939 RepID=A0ACC2F9I3_DALPE|nr:hypothetical protein DPEC_G00319420 [Dallia pectoralis]
MDLNLLQALDREKVLEVLQRDKLLRTVEEDRIRRLKMELQEIRRKGAKCYSRQYSERTCARCQRPLGKFWNSGAVCRGCSHRICSKCRVGVSTRDWKCIVCHAYREVKIKSGEWFLEEKAKKFPPDTENNQTTGEKLLKSYRRLSNIAVVPATPPPSFDAPPFCRLKDLKSLKKPFTKSMEDLMVSISSHMRRFSRSQEDVRAEQDLLTVVINRRPSFAQKSLSDNDINKSFPYLSEGPSLPKLFKSKNGDLSGSSSGTDQELSLDSECSEWKRGSSLHSTGTDSGFLELCNVTGELELAVAFNHNISSLEVAVKRCRNLSCGDVKRKKCNPYVKVCLLFENSRQSKLRTPVKRNTTDPVFNEVLNYQLEASMLSTTTLQASVWHSGTLKKKTFLGEVLVPLEGLVYQDGTTCGSNWYPLCPKPECPEGGAVDLTAAGELVVKMKFTFLSQPSWVCDTDAVLIGSGNTGELDVLITGANNLPTKANISQNTYVKGHLILSGPRELIQKTTVLKKKPGPEWSHQLQFSSVTPFDLQVGTLELHLWDHPPLSFSDRLIGCVRMDAESSWRQLLQTPNVWHDFLLPVQTNASGRRT